MDRLGLGYDAMRAANPRLVYCSIPGFSADDPRVVDAGVGGHRLRGDLDLPASSPLRPRGSDHRHRPLVHRHAAAVDVCRRDRRARRRGRAARSRSFGKGPACRGVAVRRGVRGLRPRAADGAQHGVGCVQAAASAGSRALQVQGRPLASSLPLRGPAHAVVRAGVRARLARRRRRRARSPPGRARAAGRADQAVHRAVRALGTRPSGSTTSTSAPARRARSARRPTSGCASTRAVATAMRSRTWSILCSDRLPSSVSRWC